MHINSQPIVIQKVQPLFQPTSQLLDHHFQHFYTTRDKTLKWHGNEAMESLFRHNPRFFEIQMLMSAFQTLLKVVTPCANFRW